MSSTPTNITGWVMTAPGAPLAKRSIPTPALAAGEVLVEVAGCGVCHTDVSFLHMGIKTRGELPLVLGHEISGTVRALGDGVDTALLDQPVLVPAVLPCGECELCQMGERTLCRAQLMPGNDRHGGFASHVAVPARYLCRVSDAVLAKHALWELSIVSDAVTTPFMSIKRSGLAKGQLAIVIGAGGIGTHCIQIAVAVGAKVIALDIDSAKLETARSAGADTVVDVRGLSSRDIKKQVKAEAKAIGAPKHLWKIFETSGTGPGQETAYGLLGFGAYLAVVGFTLDKITARLSNLMAFDATLRGNWGCDPLLYEETLQWIADGRIHVKPYIERHALDDINDVFDAAHHGKLLRRAVLVP